ncbi:MAG: hypothetical protein GY758_02250 [Fuerstiella sp.]|nr:hypothetical protein [Fuerstiella sp.]
MSRSVFIGTLFLLAPVAAAQPAVSAPTDTVIPIYDETVRVIDPAEFGELADANRFVPVPQEQLPELLRLRHELSLQPEPSSPIRKAELSATLEGMALRDGRLQLQIYPPSAMSRRRTPLKIAATNLQNLELHSEGRQVVIASDPVGNLVVLNNTKNVLNGTWTAHGKMIGADLVFQLALPTASVCQFVLTTPSDIYVASPDALVLPKTGQQGMSIWELHPRFPGELTIKCSRAKNSDREATAAVDAVTSFRTGVNISDAEWIVTLPSSLSNAKVLLNLNGPCSVSDIDLNAGQPLQFESEQRDGSTELQIQMPLLTTSTAIRIRGRFVVGIESEVRLPVLSPKAWSVGSVKNDLTLSSSSVRISVPPELDVHSLSLIGLRERDVAYQADGSRRLDLTQFSKYAFADIRLSTSRAVVNDAVFTDAESTEKEATAYVRVEVLSGLLSEVTWTMPASWRVTAVQETDSQRPLLFQMADDAVNPAQARVTAYLRTPLTSLSPNSSQTLTISLQSTGSVFSKQWMAPRLLNADYNRAADLQSVNGAVADIPAIGTETAALTADDVAELVPWLPTDVLASIDSARHTPATLDSPPSLTSTNRPESATIDYAVTIDQDSVRETLRVRLRSTDPLPKRIPLQVTPGVELQVSDESVTQPAPSLIRQMSEGIEELVLEVPAGIDSTNTLDILLISSRPVAAEMSAALISFPDTDHAVGSLQPPLLESNLALSITRGGNAEDVTGPVPYPADPFANAITIRNLAKRSSWQEVSGLAMALVDRHSDHFSVEMIHRFVVRSVGNHNNLVIQQSLNHQIVVFVNGRPAFPGQSNDRYRIALPTDREHAVVDIYLAYELPVAVQQQNVLRLPILAFPETESGNVTYSVLPPRQHILTLANSEMCADISAAEFINRTFIERYSQQADPALSELFRPMLTRCQLRRLATDSVAIIESDLDSGSVTLQLEDKELDSPHTIMLTTVVFLFWLIVRRVAVVPFPAIGAVLVIFLAAYHLGELRSSVVLHGVSFGTLGFSVMSVIHSIRRRWRHRTLPTSPDSQNRSSAAVVLLYMFVAATAVSADESREQILIPAQKEEAFPYVYIDRDLLSRLNSVKSQLGTTAYVIQTELNIEVEAADSFTATVQCLVASPPNQSSQLNIPLDGVTFVDCLLDGARVFPSVEQPDRGTIDIPHRSVLPPSPLGQPEPSPSTQGRDTLANWDLRTVHYSVRCTPELLTASEFRISVPHSRSPVTRVSLSDPLKIVADVNHETSSGSGTTERKDDLLIFPALYNTNRSVLDIELRTSAKPLVDAPPSASVVCTAEISPTELRLGCEFTVAGKGGRSTSVNLEIPKGHQITNVASLTGEELPWSIRDNKLTIVVPTDDDDLQQFVVTQFLESQISLHRSIPVGTVATVNGRPADDIIIVAVTSDEFLVSSVKSPDAELHKPDQARLQQLADRLRNSQWVVAVPESATQVDIEIAARVTAREAELAQKVVISDDRLHWTARCRMQVLGNPTFRQTFVVSPDVRIEEVSATVGATARLQSWTRDSESVVVSFREATRGLVVVEFTGVVSRSPGQPTQLPVFALPDSVATLISTIDISSNATYETYIKDLQSAVPLTKVDIARYVLSETPLQATLTADSRPPVISPSEDKILHAEIVAVLHNAGGNTQVTEFISLAPQHSGFDVHCRPPAGLDVDSLTVAVDGQPTTATYDTDGIVISRETTDASAARVVLVVSDVLAPVRDGLLTAALPVFEADLKIASCEVFDARGLPAAGKSSYNVPSWVVEAVDAQGLLAIPTNLDKPRSDTAIPENVITVYLSEQQRPARAAGPVSDVAYVHTQHDIQLDSLATNGRSDMMVFTTRQNADIELDVPVDIRIIDVLHDGIPVPFAVTNNIIHLHGTAQVGLFEIQWRCQPGSSLVRHKLLLPSIAAADQVHLVRLAAAEDTLWWETGSRTEDREQWCRDSQAAAAQGFLRIERPTTVADADVPENLPAIIAAPEWQKLAAISRNAAEALLSTTAGDTASAKYQYLTTDVPPEVTVTLITRPGMPSLLVGLCALMMIAVPLGRRGRSERAKQHEESSTLSG